MCAGGEGSSSQRPAMPREYPGLPRFAPADAPTPGTAARGSARRRRTASTRTTSPGSQTGRPPRGPRALAWGFSAGGGEKGAAPRPPRARKGPLRAFGGRGGQRVPPQEDILRGCRGAAVRARRALLADAARRPAKRCGQGLRAGRREEGPEGRAGRPALPRRTAADDDRHARQVGQQRRRLHRRRVWRGHSSRAVSAASTKGGLSSLCPR